MRWKLTQSSQVTILGLDMEVKLGKQLIEIFPRRKKMQIQFTPHTFGIDYDLWLENKKRKEKPELIKKRLLLRDVKKSLFAEPTTEKVLSFCVYYLNPLTATICLCKHTQRRTVNRLKMAEGRACSIL